MSLMMMMMSTIMMLISVAFFTMMERKMLSYMQTRKGPNKVGITGLMQPFSDAVKLFTKTNNQMKMNNSLMSYMTPPMALILSLSLLSILPMNKFSEMDNKQSMMMFMVLSSLAVYITLMVGWSMNSKYALMGAIRNMAQMISYEVSIFFIILFVATIYKSYSTMQISLTQNTCWLMWGNMAIFLMWMITIMAEMNRSPFDFAEGESELVSGFNVEFMGGTFALIFLAEYASIIIMSLITTTLFIGSPNSMINILPMLIIIITPLMLRGTYPRFRYDMLMALSWKIMLPSITLLVMIPPTFMIMM